ncbi:hypothetical protein GCM10023066_15980 [Nocardioides kongjuensis]
MDPQRVLSVPMRLPVTTLDSVLSAVEEALLGTGARRIWIEQEDAELCVVAEFDR